ncbi:MAG: RNA polymerase subunit sigma [Betaproteobacteria bacterium HGW-Betaproteobacteria-12]|nr:MAG: RNA polymerase subunit sigma [Betaproteobacteria bacterium HGW-Betaproteobacteria-12]
MPSSSHLATPPQSADLVLAQRIAAGDQAALKTLMRRHNQTLFRTARSILRDDFAAEEVVQEAYLLAYRSLHDFRGEAKLSTWLIRIVVNLAIRRKHRQNRDGALFADVTETSHEEVGDMDGSHSRTPEAAAANSELRRLLESHIDRLPDLYREVFVLRAVEELSVEETAAALELAEATVRTRYFRARHLLSAGLAKDIDIAVGDAFAFAGSRCDRIVAVVLDRLQQQTA